MVTHYSRATRSLVSRAGSQSRGCVRIPVSWRSVRIQFHASGASPRCGRSRSNAALIFAPTRPPSVAYQLSRAAASQIRHWPLTTQWPAGSPVVAINRRPSGQCASALDGSVHAAKCHSVNTVLRSGERTTARHTMRRSVGAEGCTTLRPRAALAVNCASRTSSWDGGSSGPPPLGVKTMHRWDTSAPGQRSRAAAVGVRDPAKANLEPRSKRLIGHVIDVGAGTRLLRWEQRAGWLAVVP